MKRILTMTALVVTLLAPAAMAAHLADFYVIPVASHTPGLGNTLWVSDIAIRNIDAANLNVQFVFIESGEVPNGSNINNSDNVFPLASDTIPGGSIVIPSNGTILLKDVLKNYRNLPAAIGAVLVGADRPFAVTSRSYVTREDGGTVGQTVPPVRDFLENTIGGKTNNAMISYLPGLINNLNYRTNLGFVAGNSGSSGGNLVVLVTLRDFSGAVIGSPRPFFIPPGTFTHLQFPSSVVSNKSFDLATAEIQVAQGNGVVVPYASVVDNKSADATFITAFIPNNTPIVGKWGEAPSLLRSLFDGVKTSDQSRRRSSTK
ncbi:MAG: hypothetical protein ABIP63_06350 [Thermoanaerobaculia bacterium]